MNFRINIWTDFSNAFTIIREMVALMIAQFFYGIISIVKYSVLFGLLTLASDSTSG